MVFFFFGPFAQWRKQLTSELGLASNLSQQLCEVGEVVGEELGAEDEVFARVSSGDLTAQQLDLTGDAQSRALECGLEKVGLAQRGDG